MEAILRRARRHGLSVLEDAAQAHGASLRAAASGSLGRRRGLQLLSEQEPRGAGRRWGDLHGRRGARRASRELATWASEQGGAPRRRHERAPRRPPGGAAAGQAPATSTTGTPQGAATRRPTAGAPDGLPALGGRAQRVHLPPLSRAGRPSRPLAGAAATQGHPAASTTRPTVASAAGLSPTCGAPGRPMAPRGVRGARRSSRCRCSPS